MKNFQGLKKIKQLKIILVVTFYLTFSAYARDVVDPAINSKRPLEFKQLSVEQGLSQCTVNCIIQDSFGFLWFGTEDGLNKYDGYSFKIFKHRPNDPNSLCHNSITSIFEDRSGALWIGASQEGLNKFDREQEVFINYRNDPDNPNSLSDNSISTIYESRDGTLWIGTSGGGLNKLTPGDSTGSYSFTRFKNDPLNLRSLSDNYISQIHEDSSGTLWIGTYHGGLNMLTLSEKESSSPSFVHFKNETNNPKSLSNDKITSIFEDRTGNLWIGTAEGLSKLVSNKNEPDRPTFIHFKNDPANQVSINDNYITSITEDLIGNLWIGTKNGGLNKLAQAEYNATSPAFIHFEHNPNNTNSIKTNDVRSIFADHSGVLWIGTYNAGVNKLDPGKKQFIHYRKEPNNRNSLNHNMVWSIFEDRKGILWIGTHGGELTKFDRKKNKFTLYPLPAKDPDVGSKNKVMSIYEDKTGVLWLAAGKPGITKFNPETEQFSFQQIDTVDFEGWNCNKINFFYKDQSGTPWFGTGSGRIYKYDQLTEEFQYFSPDISKDNCSKKNNMRAFFEDQNGTIWIGIEGRGLYKFNRETEQFSNYRANLSDPKSLSSDYISSIYEDKSGTLWLGTSGGGLNKLIPAGEEKNISPLLLLKKAPELNSLL